MKKNKNYTAVILVGCLAVVIGSVALLVYTVFMQRTTNTSTNEESTSLSVLECKTSTPKEPFFTDSKATKEEHKIKMTFTEAKVGKISYEYRGVFETDEDAEQANALMHANFNIHMGKYTSTLGNTFGNSNKEVRINIYADVGKMSNIAAKVFSLSEQEGIDFYSYTDKTLEAIYQAQGFLCQMKE